jgi:hypothetical protein
MHDHCEGTESQSQQTHLMLAPQAITSTRSVDKRRIRVVLACRYGQGVTGASSAPDSGTMDEDEVVVLVVVVGSNPRHPQVGPDLAVRAPISEPRVRASRDANDQKA